MDRAPQDCKIPGETSLTADADRSDHQPGGRRQRGARRCPGISSKPTAAHPGILGSCIELPGTGTDSVSNYSLSPELVVSLTLKRAHGGGVAKLGDRYLDGGFPTPGYLTGAFDELIATGLLAIASPDSGGLQRVTLTGAGHARYTEPRAAPRRAAVRVPDPQFCTTPTPTGQRSNNPALVAPPSGQPDPDPMGTP